MNKYRTTNKGFTLVELLIVVCIIGLLAALVLPTKAQAENSLAPGQDVVCDGVVSNLTLILTNGTINTLIISNSVVWTGVSQGTGRTSDTLRVSATFQPDAATDYYLSPAPYAPVGSLSNNLIVQGTAGNTNYFPIFGPGAGIKVLHGAASPTNTFTTTRQTGLWNMPIAISASASVTKSNAIILTIPITDLFHQSL